MVDVCYSHSKIGEAVQTLAVHPGGVKERLTEAVNTLTMVDPTIFTLPGMYEGAADFWDRIQIAITAAPRDPQRGVFGPSIDRLTESQASEIAQLIVSLDSMVQSYFENQDPA
jgi:hypothetical protein